MRRFVHQILTNFSKRDAVGTDSLLIRSALRDLGYDSEIFHEESGQDGESRSLSDLEPFVNRLDTALVFHFSIASDFASRFITLKNPKICRYHNVTPPEYFCAPEEEQIHRSCSRGRQQIAMLARFSDLLIADSAYNAAEFQRFAAIPTTVIPVFRDYSALQKEDEIKELALSLKACAKPVLLSVGRICPNKAQDDLLKLVAMYRYTFNTDLVLILVGSFFSPKYRSEIVSYAQDLGLKLSFDLGSLQESDLIITGSISDAALSTLYRHASVYCSMSEHEGFGVPLVEAQYFNLPVLAHRAAAVPETLGDNALFFDKSDASDLLQKLRWLVTHRHDIQSHKQDTFLTDKYGLSHLKKLLEQALAQCWSRTQ